MGLMVKKQKKKPGRKAAEVPTGQLNYNHPATFLGAFSVFCDGNNYSQARTLRAGVRALMSMSHDKRVAVFRDLAAWEAGGCKGFEAIAPDATADLPPGTAQNVIEADPGSSKPAAERGGQKGQHKNRSAGT